MSSTEQVSAAKKAWRHTLLERRTARAETTRSAENTAFRDIVLRWVHEQRIGTMGAYVPVGAEPGSHDLLGALRDAGIRVLLPIVVSRSPLDWAEYRGPDSLESATFGLLEPSGQRLGPEAIGAADGMLVPALAVDRLGVRIGNGAGYYDRSLPHAMNAQLIALVRDEEFVEELPGEPHDVRVNGLITPGRGLISLPM